MERIDIMFAHYKNLIRLEDERIKTCSYALKTAIEKDDEELIFDLCYKIIESKELKDGYIEKMKGK